MFEKKADNSHAALDTTITELMNDMQTHDGDSEEYATMLNRLERLVKQREKLSPRRFSPDTLLIVGGNLLGILIIVAYEHKNVITSKAMSQLGKLR